MADPSNAAAPSGAGWRFIVMLGSLAAIAPLGMSIHVQSIPEMAGDLGTSYASGQFTVSIYLFTFGFVQLVVGPLSDRLGRRPILFGGLAVFTCGCLLAAVAPSIEIMLVARFLQAAGGCASLVTPRAVVQDRLTGLEAARVLGLVSMIQSSAPVVAPVIGGIIDLLLGWPGIFAVLGFYGAVAGIAAWLRLAESRPTEGGAAADWGTILSRYARLLRDRRYLAYMAVFSLGTTGYFGFLASGPAVLIGDMGLAPWQFSVILGAIAAQFVIGGYAATLAVMRLGIDRLLFIATLWQVISVIGFWSVAASQSPVWITVALCAFTLSNGLLFANSLAGAIAVDPRIAGSAASLLGAVQFLIGGLVAIAVANLPMEDFGLYPAILLLLAIGAFLAAIVAMTAPRLHPA